MKWAGIGAVSLWSRSDVLSRCSGHLGRMFRQVGDSVLGRVARVGDQWSLFHPVVLPSVCRGTHFRRSTDAYGVDPIHYRDASLKDVLRWRDVFHRWCVERAFADSLQPLDVVRYNQSNRGNEPMSWIWKSCSSRCYWRVPVGSPIWPRTLRWRCCRMKRSR